ncbi:MAG: leucine--tRNA ligase [Candidatus Heimdallarchaeota archaeon]|nr:leucine--tRNA ligase [Candidatus Heimdallarchaeota archaeon]
MSQDEIVYDFESVEKKWQEQWNEEKLFESDRDDRPKYFINFPFPYLNGAPHLGHGYSLMKAEVMARYQRMLGKNVLFPFAFHATGEPIVGMAKRVKAGDESQIRALKMSGISEKDISKFTNPEYIVEYFMNEWIQTNTKLGLAIDWRRKFVTTQMTPVFSKFIEWQYRKLKTDGYVIQGSHPVIWCPNCGNPTGDHDRLKGEGARVVDFIMLKFHSKIFDAYFVPATLRPETIFGVTNMFIHPEAEYVKIKVGNEHWVVSRTTVLKLQDQQYDVEIVETIDNNEIIGSTTINPVNKKEVMILPGAFIDPEGSTGVVMSVPAHAPMDWVVLKQIKTDAKALKQYGITQKDLEAIQPISLITIDEYGEFPAGEEIEKMKITDMHDPKVKEATKIIYRREHAGGVLKAITGKYEGKTVQTVKDIIIEDFVNDNIASILKEPADVVICRCSTRNHVKYLENQWFLKFGDQEWKDVVHQLLDEMDIIPKEAIPAFHNTVDWLENKACARRSGMGTPMPWDTDWIIETLSDSVIYMVYYIISKYVNAGEFKEEWATDDIFNYLIISKGNRKSLSQKYGIPEKLMKTIQDDIEYYYGFDLRTSGKDLLNNHLTFMLMHHTAVFPKKYWPKGIAVNGYVAIIKPGSNKAEKMSKSKGNFRTIEDVVSAFGRDATRLGFAIAGEGFKDAQFALKEGESYQKWLISLYSLSKEEIDDDKMQTIDYWLQSRIQGYIQRTREHLENMETRSAFQRAYHEINQDLKWYLKRRDSKGPAFRYAVETMVKLVTPYIPHITEEIWDMWGNETFISEETYPEVIKKFINEDSELSEKVLGDILADLRDIRALIDRKGDTAKKIEIFIAPSWKFDVYNEAFEGGLNNLTARVMKNPDMRKMGKLVPAYATSLMKAGGPPDFRWTFNLEWDILLQSRDYLEREMGIPVEIIKADESNHPKAKIAVPRRPGINMAI